jgi:phosphopantothenoylcysteine decarboxylase/phosphopantothenate--cysteine ligase
MRYIITAGPTYEPLDAVRRLTNLSTGRLGTELGNFLASRGHEVTLLIAEGASYHGERRAQKVATFTTTANLRDLLQGFSDQPVDAVFHAAAVNDFAFGKIWLRSPQGELTEINSGKVSTRDGTMLAELLPTPKIIAELRHWFPKARLVGWKFEVEGDRASVIRMAESQITSCLTDCCIANGPAYGAGFGLVLGHGEATHLADRPALFEALEKFSRQGA